MDVHHPSSSSSSSSSTKRKNILLISLNGALIAIGNIGGPLIMRLYFLHGGKMIWLSSWLETAGCPIMFLPLIISYSIHRRRIVTTGSRKRFFTIGPRESIAAAGIGILLGADDYFHAWGVAKLPVTTATLIFATQLGFTALFAFFMVNQKFTPFSINAVVLLMAGAGVLATNTKADLTSKGVNVVVPDKKDYVTGFVMSIATAALYGLILPLIEITYKNVKEQPVTYKLVMEIQLLICLFATGFCTVGGILNRDFQVTYTPCIFTQNFYFSVKYHEFKSH